MKLYKIDSWNLLVKIKLNKRIKHELRAQAELLLKSMNTAGGTDIMKNEIKTFIELNKKYLQSVKESTDNSSININAMYKK